MHCEPHPVLSTIIFISSFGLLFLHLRRGGGCDTNCGAGAPMRVAMRGAAGRLPPMGVAIWGVHWYPPVRVAMQGVAPKDFTSKGHHNGCGAGGGVVPPSSFRRGAVQRPPRWFNRWRSRYGVRCRGVPPHQSRNAAVSVAMWGVRWDYRRRGARGPSNEVRDMRTRAGRGGVPPGGLRCGVRRGAAEVRLRYSRKRQRSCHCWRMDWLWMPGLTLFLFVFLSLSLARSLSLSLSLSFSSAICRYIYIYILYIYIIYIYIHVTLFVCILMQPLNNPEPDLWLRSY